MPVTVALNRELTLEFVRITEAAAIAAGRLLGRNDKDAIDGAAVEAMRHTFDTVAVDGQVVIGEGEMDEAPMLYIGERVGQGVGPHIDIAVDPVEGTNLVARGLAGAIATLAAGPQGSLFHAPDVYMDKLAVGPWAAGKIDISAPLGENIRRVAAAKDKPVNDVTVVILDRPRNQHLIDAAREAGARIMLIREGDVLAALNTGFEESGVDLLAGIGGAPEGVLSAAALRCLGGDFQGRLWVPDEHERQRVLDSGVSDPDALLTMQDLVKSDDVTFAATGITDSEILRGVRYQSARIRTHSLIMRGATGTVRFIEALHNLERKTVVLR
jgi:fructose-1,6-bisphosphatase II